MNTIKNDIAETITELKQFKSGLGEIISALTTPIPAKPHIISYQDFRIDQTTGICWYKDHKYKPRKSSITYIVLDLLVSKMGQPVSYTQMSQAIRAVRGKDTRITKDTIPSAVRDLRRKFGINSKDKPQDDVFLATGDGYRIIPR